MTNKAKIGVVGICQIHGFGLALAQLLPEATVRVFEAPIAQREGLDEEAAEYLAGCNVVFSHGLDETHGALAMVRLAERVTGLRRVPLVVFAGWHPDMTYIHHLGRKLPSPVGVYHSAIVASAYSFGCGPDEAELLFNRFVFARVGYFDQYEASWGLVVREMKEAGLAPYLRFDAWGRDGPFMHGINHPKIRVLADIARASAIAAELAPPDCPAPVPEYDWLACDTGWPIYPEIAEKLGGTGSYGFKPRSEIVGGGIVPMLSLSEMIRESYALYRRFPPGVFAGSDLAPTREALAGLLAPSQSRSPPLNGGGGEPAAGNGAAAANGASDRGDEPPGDGSDEPALPTDTLPAAEFIVRHMHRSVDLADGVRFSAVPETAEPVGGDTWFWTDDNAKVLEFLSRPELWARFPEQTAEILHFVRAMCRPPFIFRRLSTPSLAPAEDEHPLPGYRHSLMNIRYDLQRGGVIVGMRFHDARNFDHLLMSGNMVEFTCEGRRFTVPVEPAIGDTGVEQDGHILTLRYAAELGFTPRREALRLGRITYLFTFDARTVLFQVEVRLDVDPAAEISDVVLTIGHDHLGRRYYDTVDANTNPSATPLFTQGKPGRATIPAAGASYYVIRHGPFSGDALAIHSAPRDPKQLVEFVATGEVSGQLHQVMARYRFPGPQRGETLVAGEHKLLTGGGFYDRVSDYAGFMREAIAAGGTGQAAYDFSISYDYGVVLNAFAKCYASCADVPGLADPAALQADLRALIDTYLKSFMDITIAGHQRHKNTVFSRELSFVILAVVTMYRATGAAEYLEYLTPFCEALLDLERQFSDVAGDPASGFIMKIDADPIAHVDCHAASLLALTQAAGLVHDERLTAALNRGLGSFCVASDTVEVGVSRRIDSVATLLIDPQGVKRFETPYWNFKAGLTLRLFAALRDSQEPAVQAVAARHRERIDLYETILRRQLLQSTTWRDEAVEFRCSVSSHETNSETQPWVMLGLVGHPAD